MKASQFKFEISSATNNKWDITLEYFKNNKPTKFNKEAVLELRDRALLMQHTTGYKDRERNDHPSEEEERRLIEEHN